MYNKLFTKILDSSVWLESTATRIVWLTFIASMDETGFAQFAAVANVAHRARVSVEEAQEALQRLESPDPDSSDPENEGRRVERVPGGWLVLNAQKHRALVTRAIIQDQTRERVKRHRSMKRTSNAPVTPSEADTDTEADLHPLPPQGGRRPRITRADRKAAKDIRARRMGRCAHEPTCADGAACIEAIAAELAARRTDA